MVTLDPDKFHFHFIESKEFLSFSILFYYSVSVIATKLCTTQQKNKTNEVLQREEGKKIQ